MIAGPAGGLHSAPLGVTPAPHPHARRDPHAAARAQNLQPLIKIPKMKVKSAVKELWNTVHTNDNRPTGFPGRLGKGSLAGIVSFRLLWCWSLIGCSSTSYAMLCFHSCSIDGTTSGGHGRGAIQHPCPYQFDQVHISPDWQRPSVTSARLRILINSQTHEFPDFYLKTGHVRLDTLLERDGVVHHQSGPAPSGRSLFQEICYRGRLSMYRLLAQKLPPDLFELLHHDCSENPERNCLELCLDGFASTEDKNSTQDRMDLMSEIVKLLPIEFLGGGCQEVAKRQTLLTKADQQLAWNWILDIVKSALRKKESAVLVPGG